MKHTLLKQLSAYSTFATASFLVANHSNAQILYTNPPDIILDNSGDLTYIDLNNDGVNDFKIIKLFNDPLMQGQEFNFNSRYADVIGVVSFSCSATERSDSVAMAALPRGYNIGPGGHFWTASYFRYDLFCHSGNCVPSFAGKQNRFLGVDIRQTSGTTTTNYGWIRVVVSDNCDKIKIKDWAINLTPGEPILAGQKSFTMENGKEIPQFVSDDDNDFSSVSIHSSAKTITIEQESNEPMKIIMLNMTGQVVKSKESTGTMLTFDNDDLPAGIYLVEVSSGNRLETKTVLLE